MSTAGKPTKAPLTYTKRCSDVTDTSYFLSMACSSTCSLLCCGSLCAAAVYVPATMAGMVGGGRTALALGAGVLACVLCTLALHLYSKNTQFFIFFFPWDIPRILSRSC